jgi:hypothetical protein
MTLTERGFAEVANMPVMWCVTLGGLAGQVVLLLLLPLCVNALLVS